MRAAQIKQYGGVDAVSYTTDSPRPTPGEGQVLVEVRAASLNPVDTAIRAGYMHQMVPLSFPATLGGDFAGVVVEPGAGVAGFRKGDEVYGQASALLGGSGTLAEFVAAPGGFTAPMPTSVDFTTAAALPLTAASALQAVAENLNVKSGQRILIHGAGGGVGSIAVQIAKHLGAEVIATSFSDDVEFVKSLGVDQVIDASTHKFEEVVRNVDGVLDLVRGDTAERSYSVLKRGGTLVSLTAQPDEVRMKEFGVRMIAQFTQPTTERLKKVAELVDQGVIKPRVERTFPLSRATEAFTYFEMGKPQGKVVVEVS